VVKVEGEHRRMNRCHVLQITLCQQPAQANWAPKLSDGEEELDVVP
jgi:hypothetical protein